MRKEGGGEHKNRRRGCPGNVETDQKVFKQEGIDQLGQMILRD